MPSDLTAAASRYTADDNQCQMAFLQDAFALADFAAGLLDEEPIDQAWLESIGFSWDYADLILTASKDHRRWCVGHDDDGRWFYSSGTQNSQHATNIEIPPTTRGAVRRLLFALQIETKENR